MKEKNRFSGLLKHLMTVAKLKNYTLAKELQYDESYISKWASGSLLPTEKNSEKVLREISRCVVNALDEDGRKQLYSEYEVDRDGDLEDAVYDNLMAEFGYVMDLKESTGSEIAVKTTYYPELTLSQFIQKMRHPVLRQVKALDVIMAVDILSLDRHYQLSLAELENNQNVNMTQRIYPGVHFSMLINLDGAERHCWANAVFLLNLLTNLSSVEFLIYACPQSVGKIVFSVRDAYSIAGMIMDENHCIAVSASEEPKNSNAIYERLKSMCSQEMLAVRTAKMTEMLNSTEYTNFLLARKQRWILGHITEHFLPDSIFEPLADAYCASHPEVRRETLNRAHMLSRGVITGMGVRILVFESALTNFAVTGEVDFFNTKVYLDLQQRQEYLQYLCKLVEQNPVIEVKTLREGAFSDIQYIPNPTVFLSDSPCYLRLPRKGRSNNISIINKIQMCDLLRGFYERLWEETVLDVEALTELVRDTIRMVEIQILANE